MKNIPSIKPTYGDTWVSGIDISHHFISFSPLTKIEFAVYEMGAYLFLSIVENNEDFIKFLDMTNIPYEMLEARHALTVRVKTEYFQKRN